MRISLRERRIKRKSYRSIDRYGYRYVSFGAAALLITIAFAVDILKLLGQSPLANVPSELVIIVLSLITLVIILWAEIKSRLTETNN